MHWQWASTMILVGSLRLPYSDKSIGKFESHDSNSFSTPQGAFWVAMACSL